jgi:hypothetical protein
MIVTASTSKLFLLQGMISKAKEALKQKEVDDRKLYSKMLSVPSS